MENIQKVVRNILENYLILKKQRKTKERFIILEEIYNFEGHFSIEELYLLMKNKKLNISRATMYNTIELLLECDLINKHQFDLRSTLYEKSFKLKQHDHMICKECGKIFEFCDPRISEIISDIAEIYNFYADYHELYIHGLCAECQKK